MADDIVPPDEWDGTEWVPLHVLAHHHDHKGYSEEMCVRCGWIMGQTSLNCQNDDTPHVFPSQQAEIERLRSLCREAQAFIEHDKNCGVVMGRLRNCDCGHDELWRKLNV